MAAGHSSSPQANEALEKLCKTYWYPLYAYLRRSGRDTQDAQDLTQAFFARLIEKKDFALADREKGKFRFYLIGALKHFLADQHDKATALKRGGGQTFISFDAQTAEQRYHLEPVDGASPDKLFERRWAWRWCRRKPALAAALLVIVILLLTVIIGWPIAAYRIHQEWQLLLDLDRRISHEIRQGPLPLMKGKAA